MIGSKRLRWSGVALVAALCAAGAGAAFADNDKKEQVWSLVSDTNVLGDADDYSGVYVPGSKLEKLTFDQIKSLSTDFYVNEGDCGGGSPRFQVALDTDGDGEFDGNVFVYIGPAPSFTDCPLQTWTSTGNLVDDPDLRWDTSQFVGGTFYDSHDDAVALVGDAKVLDVSLVVDGGWAVAGGRQDIWVADAQVNHFKLSSGFGGAEKVHP